MRVISGTAKGRPLKAPPGMGTRPMTDRLKTSLFDTLAPYGFEGARVLDLYAGSGSLGIEMLSRGAQWCDFVEHSPAVARVIRDNLRTTGLEDRARVYVMPVARFLSMQEASLRRKQHDSTRLTPDSVDRGAQYDIILLDPPYADPAIHSTLEAVARWPLLAPDGLVVIGHATPVKLYEEYGEGRIHRVRHRAMGGSSFSIYEVVR